MDRREYVINKARKGGEIAVEGNVHGPMDKAQSCGSTSVATASRSTLNPIASCTASVPICLFDHGQHHNITTYVWGTTSLTITAGSFVRILDNSGTIFCVRLVWSIGAEVIVSCSRPNC
jgi:hypothetical protein